MIWFSISYKKPLLPEELIYNLSKTISYGLNSHSQEMDKETFAETNLKENFTPHSCSSSSATKTFNMSLDILDILRKACWNNAKIL